jgi:hypothetical protein
LIRTRYAPSGQPDCSAPTVQTISIGRHKLRERTVSLNAPEPDEYAARHYDVSWRSVKAGAVLAVLAAAITFLV